MKKAIIVVSITLFVLAGYGAAYYFYNRYTKAQALLDNPEQISKNELSSVMDKLNKLMELPQEEPTLATVLDKEKLKTEPFFEKSENGDKLLIFSNARLAILYRPSNNKIINVAPLVLGNQGQQPEDQSTTEESNP